MDLWINFAVEVRLLQLIRSLDPTKFSDFFSQFAIFVLMISLFRSNQIRNYHANSIFIHNKSSNVNVILSCRTPKGFQPTDSVN